MEMWKPCPKCEICAIAVDYYTKAIKLMKANVERLLADIRRLKNKRKKRRKK